MSKRYKWSDVVLICVAIALLLLANGSLNAQAKLECASLTGYGGRATSSGFRLLAAGGQAGPAGKAASANFRLEAGFLACTNDDPGNQAPILSVSPATLDFGTSLTSLTFQISNSGSGSLTWNVSENPDKPWITSLSPASGSGNATVTVSVDRSGLSPSDYSGRITVSSNGGNQDLTINMSVGSVSDNILVNGDFSDGDTGWLLFVAPEATASGSVKNGEYAVSITNGSNVDWHIQLIQSNLLIENGKTYSVSFDAYAASPRQIAFYIRKASAPHTAYSGYQTFSLTASKQKFSFAFKMNDPTDSNADFSFVLGTSNVDAFFDNVILTKQETGNAVLSINPTTLDFGASATSKGFDISNAGSGTLSWGVSENETWITTVSPASGNGNAAVTVNVDRSGLSPGDHSGEVTVTSNGGNQELTVRMNVGGTSGPSIAPDAPATASCGQEFYVPIAVGDPNAVSDLFGVSFDLNYATTHIDYVSHSFADPQGSVSNILGSNIVPFAQIDDAAGKISVGVTKTGGAGASGSGPVIWIEFKSSDDTPDPTSIVWSLSDVTANDASGGDINLSPSAATTAIVCGCDVWPGDTNNDGRVDARDVLPIGLHFGKTGPRRPNASPLWSAQSVVCWEPEAATFADAGGSGRVGSEDVLPIGLNFGKTHSAATLALRQGFTSSPKSTFLRKNGPNGTLQTPKIKPVVQPVAGDSIVVDILVTDITGLFGLSFDLVYTDNSGAIEALSAEADPFFGSDIIFFPNINTATKTVSVGMSRKAGQGGAQGTGVVASVHLKGSESAPLGASVSFDLQNVTANDENGNPITFTVEPGDPLITDVEEESETTTATPESFKLSQNYPNPFNPETRISYELSEQTKVVLKVMNLLGQEIRRLVDEEKPAGFYEVTWNGKDSYGRRVASGVYLYRLESKGLVQTRKMLLLR